jgi:hypothetical protein
MAVYIVETRMGDVWEAVWSEDQEPMTFDSEEEAEVEIAETLEDLQEAYELGGKSQRTKDIRSATPRGFAKAVYAANAKGGV